MPPSQAFQVWLSSPLKGTTLMSRYVKKKHGLVIGSGNVFFHQDANGNFMDYPCILSFNGYTLKQVNTLNYVIVPPAIQMLWTTRKLPAPTTRLFDRQWVEQAEPNAWFTKFLNDHCPGWGLSTQQVSDPFPLDYTVFLAKRGHAVLISKMVDQQLDGLSFR